MLDYIKTHPWLFGGILIGGFVLMMLLSRSSGTEAAIPGTPDSSGAANAVNNANAQAAAAIQVAQMQKDAASEQLAAQVQVATLQAGVQDNANLLAANAAQFATASQERYYTQRDTLAAQVENKKTDAQLSAILSNNATQVQQTSIMAQSMIDQANINASALITTSAISADTIKHMGDLQFWTSMDQQNTIRQQNELTAATQSEWINAQTDLYTILANRDVAVAQNQRPCDSILFGLIKSC